MELAATMHEDARRLFSELLERHRGIVFKVAYSYCPHPDDRAELVQEIAAQLWRAYPAFDPARASFSTWMYRIALNVAISQLRGSRQRHERSVPLDEAVHDVAGAGTDFETAEQLRLLQRCIAQLQPLDRALLLLYLEDRSHREIAEILGISEGNAATKISRLKQRIRNDMA
jgi:RNA polymerase sigma-70 factor (ECF subfamily)